MVEYGCIWFGLWLNYCIAIETPLHMRAKLTKDTGKSKTLHRNMQIYMHNAYFDVAHEVFLEGNDREAHEAAHTKGNHATYPRK